jgi:hypothetical protein
MKVVIRRIKAGIAALKTWLRQLSLRIYVAILPANIPVANDI